MGKLIFLFAFLMVCFGVSSPARAHSAANCESVLLSNFEKDPRSLYREALRFTRRQLDPIEAKVLQNYQGQTAILDRIILEKGFSLNAGTILYRGIVVPSGTIPRQKNVEWITADYSTYTLSLDKAIAFSTDKGSTGQRALIAARVLKNKWRVGVTEKEFEVLVRRNSVLRIKDKYETRLPDWRTVRVIEADLY